jgi:hypothetical protein
MFHYEKLLKNAIAYLVDSPQRNSISYISRCYEKPKIVIALYVALIKCEKVLMFLDIRRRLKFKVKYDKPIYKAGDKMTIKKFLKFCEEGVFIDYDGFCHLVKGNKMCGDLFVYPSERKRIPKDATHVVWYNR